MKGVAVCVLGELFFFSIHLQQCAAPWLHQQTWTHWPSSLVAVVLCLTSTQFPLLLFLGKEKIKFRFYRLPSSTSIGETLRQLLKPNLIIDEERACSSTAATNDSLTFPHYQEEQIHTGQLFPPIGAAVPSNDLTNGWGCHSFLITVTLSKHIDRFITKGEKPSFLIVLSG